MTQQVVVLKLSSGEEIIGRTYKSPLGLSSGNPLHLEKVRVLVIAPTAPGRMGLRLMPWLAAAQDAVVEISASAVITTVLEQHINKDLVAGYLQETTGIDLSAPPAGTLIKP